MWNFERLQERMNEQTKSKLRPNCIPHELIRKSTNTALSITNHSDKRPQGSPHVLIQLIISVLYIIVVIVVVICCFFVKQHEYNSGNASAVR
jgi:hypothetical protein